MATKKKAAKQVTTRSPLVVGNAVFIRTVTHYHTGRIIEISAHEIVLDDAAWVADTGRFAMALANGNLDEVEPYPGAVSVARGAIVDVCVWPHALPREAK